MNFLFHRRDRSLWLMLIALVLCAAVYRPGLSGAFIFDDYPNIVDNRNLQIADASVPNLVSAALSSPASEFKRPLASLSFAANYLFAGLAPFSWKLTNLVIHLLNGLLIFLLARRLLLLAVEAQPVCKRPIAEALSTEGGASISASHYRAGITAALIAAGWLLLPINLTGVLYVVQRMESLANLFVLAGLLGYVTARQRMLAGRQGLVWCIVSLLVPTALGLLAKETAVMLPLYAFLVECTVFRFARDSASERRLHRGLVALFVFVLLLPMLAGIAWLLPGLLKSLAWARRDFTLVTRLLSEARIVTDYVAWTLLPTPDALSFYHDDFSISTGLLSPWTTLASVLFLVALAAVAWTQRHRRPLVALGLSFYLGCHLLTGTILPLELIYEHRNYFASFGLLLAVLPLLAAPGVTNADDASRSSPAAFDRPLPMSLPRYVLLGGLLLLWTVETAITANAWGSPLTLAQDLAARAPASPRAQYELGRTYIVYSHYNPGSPFIEPAYAALETAAALPRSSILPQQALIFMNARMGRPLKDAWWNSMISKLKATTPSVQDDSSLGALTKCAVDRLCDLPRERMVSAFAAALSHRKSSPRLMETYGDYAWNVLGDRDLGLKLSKQAATAAPSEPAYRITLIRMLIALGKQDEAQRELAELRDSNVGGRLDTQIQDLDRRVGQR